ESLRAGERWQPELERSIQRADVFQLFWSRHAMRSEYVQKEWRYALSLGRANFVRPVYWQDPLPADEKLGLPPRELREVHFSKLSAVSATSRWPGVPAAGLRPAVIAVALLVSVGLMLLL